MEQTTNEAVVQKNPGGARLKKGGKGPLVALGIVVGVLALAYVGLCAYAGSLDTFYLTWGKTFTDAELDKMQQRLDTLYGYRVKLTPEMRETYKTIGGIPHLDGGYTVFGEITEGLDVVEKIQLSATDDNDRPLEDIRIIKASVIEEVKQQAKKPVATRRPVRRNTSGNRR